LHDEGFPQGGVPKICILNLHAKLLVMPEGIITIPKLM